MKLKSIVTCNLLLSFRMLALAAFAGVLGLGFADRAFAVEVRTVALSGDAAPGSAFAFSQFSPPIINGSNQAAFTGAFEDNQASNITGYWSEGSGSLAAVAIEGQSAPSTALNFGEFDDPNNRIYLNENGQAAFQQRLSDFNTSAIFSETGAGNSLVKVIAGGDPAPGTTDPNRVFQPFLGTIGGFNDAGSIAMQGAMPPTGAPPGNFASTGIWSQGGGPLDKVAEVGDAAPGGGTFTSVVDFPVPSFNNNGHVAFRGATTGGPSQGIYNDVSGSLARLVASGDAAPGGGTFALFNTTTSINNADNIAFGGILSGSVADGIWVSRGGGIDKVAVEGDLAPGGGGAVFGTGALGIESGFIGLDASGNAAFTSWLSDGTRGLFSEGLGGLHAVAISGDVAPDSGGATYLGVLRWTINSLGQTTFIAQLSDNTDAIFAEDTSGVLHRIVGQGELLEVAPGDFREILTLGFQGLDGSFARFGNNYSSGFNDEGAIGFYASLFDEENGDTQGVFVTTSPVPEPSTLVLLALGSLFLLWRRRRKHG
jgi:hypothetical protein